jgi:acetoin:2,6-dichlorophenolindophenol oxidoreductase subunit beta
LLVSDPRVILLGEDIAEPYGGAFKVTRGLSTEFPQRVWTTPVSEAAITGVAAGLALEGFRPIVEIMFGDFVTLAFDQILNHASKYQAMYAGQVSCPLVVRLPSGGGRGYGPTHSQSLEKHFFGIPHLRVLAASIYHDPRALWDFVVSQQLPALHVEHKLLYPLDVFEPEVGDDELHIESLSHSSEYPATVGIRAVDEEDCAVTVVAYGYQATIAARIVSKMAIESETFIHLLVPSQIAPIDLGPILASVSRTGRLITVEEGTSGWSWGTQIATDVNLALFGDLRAPVKVLSSTANIIPSARNQESGMLISSAEIEDAILDSLR